jgi:hypothetical protein
MGQLPDRSSCVGHDRIWNGIRFVFHSAFRERTTIHPGAGMYVGDPLFDQWRAEIEVYRQQIEDDPNIA